VNLDDLAEALFCTDLSGDLPGEQVRDAATATLACLGAAVCAERMAYAYGLDQVSAAARMRWAHDLALAAFEQVPA
jgi:hypothetical protein